MNEYSNFVEGNIVECSIDELIDAINKINVGDSVSITVGQLKLLDTNLSFTNKRKLKRCPIYLYMDSPRELTYDEFNQYNNKYKFHRLFIKGFFKEQGIYNQTSDKPDYIYPNILLIYLQKFREKSKGYVDANNKNNINKPIDRNDISKPVDRTDMNNLYRLFDVNNLNDINDFNKFNNDINKPKKF